MARRLTVQATAYGPPWDAMEGTGVTSTGVNLQHGQQKLVVAVDPSVIPYGTKLRIPDNPFGNPNLVFTASDTGGAIKGNRLDFFVASGRHDQNRWGRKNTTVEIVGHGSPRDVAVLGGKPAGGLSQHLSSPPAARAAVPGYNVSSTASAGGQPITLPDTGDASGLSQMLLQSVGQKPQGLAGGMIAAPSFSADQRYAPNTGGIRPAGVNPVPQSGVADQLAQLATVDTSLPPVSNMASSSTATGRVPGVPASGAPTSANPAIRNAAGGAKATLAWARSVIGTAETAGANHGPRIDQWEKAFGMSGQPWCAIFTSLAVTKGGAPPTARTASVAAVRGQAMSGQGGYQKGFVNPARAHAGDLILFGNDHIGLVESVGPKGITMIAGNDSNRVQRRVVAPGSGDIVRPKYQ